jgi:thioredoxin reductase (NADPH)
VVKFADGREVSTYAVVIATGMAVRMLEAPGIEQFIGAGVYYGAALSEAARYRDQDIVIVGGANSAGQGALFFSRYARKVTIVVRARDGLAKSMSHYLADRISQVPNIEVISGAEVVGVAGNSHLEQVTIRRLDTGAERTLDTAGLFIFIGTAPSTDYFAGTLAMDDKKFILTGSLVDRVAHCWRLERDPLMFETNIPGVFAVGDMRSGANRRVAMAVGEGSAVIYSVHRYLETV